MNRVGWDLVGGYGYDIVTTTGAVTGTWFAICGMASGSAFSTLTELGPSSRTGTIGSMPLCAGTFIFGAFTNFTLASGAVIAYRIRNIVANP